MSFVRKALFVSPLQIKADDKVSAVAVRMLYVACPEKLVSGWTQMIQ